MSGPLSQSPVLQDPVPDLKSETPWQAADMNKVAEALRGNEPVEGKVQYLETVVFVQDVNG